MARYHVRANGDVGRCSARIKCPFSNEEGVDHVNGKKNAERLVEKKLSETNSVVPSSKAKKQYTTLADVDKDQQKEMAPWRKRVSRDQYMALSVHNTLRDKDDSLTRLYDYYGDRLKDASKVLSEEDFEQRSKEIQQRVESFEELVKKDGSVLEDFDKHRKIIDGLDKEKRRIRKEEEVR